MAKKSSKAAGKPLADDEPAKTNQRTVLPEAVTTETHAVKTSAKTTPAQEPPHLLTPLATVWPTATLPESPKSPQAAVIAPAPKPTAPKTVNVTFKLLEPEAKQVLLGGDFNGWASGATPMQRQADGHWETSVALAPGRHEYKFLIDGNWKHDPLAHVNVWNQNGTLNSVAQVRP